MTPDAAATFTSFLAWPALFDMLKPSLIDYSYLSVSLV
jgi:hypothetical protein